MNQLNSVRQHSAGVSLDDVCFTPPYGDTHFLFCAEVPIISSEYFEAGVQDIKPSCSLLVDTESFNSKKTDRVKYKGVVYAIYRTYASPTGRTQLYLNVKAGVK